MSIYQMLLYLIYFVFTWLLLFILLIFTAKFLIQRKKLIRQKADDSLHIGILHPYCNAGGGGERVLWCAIKALQKRFPHVKIVIYTGDINVTPEEFLKKARGVFNVVLNAENIDFLFLHKRKWIEAIRYPYFTLFLQNVGSLFLGFEILFKHQPDLFIDTMGYAFTLPLFRFFGKCTVGCYVHYPTISTDMLKRVRSRTYSHNNRNYVARNPFLTWMKLIYYHHFAWLYSVTGRASHFVMVNSTWTENHILYLWKIPFRTHRVYPPCDVGYLKNLQHIDDGDKIIIMSVGQFRPEKDHPLQLHAMYELRTLLVDNEELWNRLKLIIAGSCRDTEDYERMKNMQDLAKHLSLENSVEFKVNITFQELIQNYQLASIGLHTMWNEHFGIGIVECMAAGLIMVAHRSGGPLMDIVETSEGSQTGYLAMDSVDYANCIATILFNSKEQNDTIRMAARSACDRFSEQEFENNFLRVVSPFIDELMNK